MKDLLQHIKLDVPNQVIQAEFPKQLKHLGKLRLQPGQKLWELNLRTGLIQAADVEIIGGLQSKSKRITIQEGFLYEPAINLIVAAKKFKKKLNKYLHDKG